MQARARGDTRNTSRCLRGHRAVCDGVLVQATMAPPLPTRPTGKLGRASQRADGGKVGEVRGLGLGRKGRGAGGGGVNMIDG